MFGSRRNLPRQRPESARALYRFILNRFDTHQSLPEWGNLLRNFRRATIFLLSTSVFREILHTGIFFVLCPVLRWGTELPL